MKENDRFPSPKLALELRQTNGFAQFLASRVVKGRNIRHFS
jgi:hypothetical protein